MCECMSFPQGSNKVLLTYLITYLLTYSIVAQVVCDHEHKVMSVAAGWSGRVHDAQLFANLSIKARLEVKHSFHTGRDV